MTAKRRAARPPPAKSARPAREPGAEDARAAREIMSRAIRRLNLLESIIMGAAVVVALGGGWLGALLARSTLGLPFRTTWMVLSLTFFVIPGAIAWAMERRGRRRARKKAEAAGADNPTERPEG